MTDHSIIKYNIEEFTWFPELYILMGFETELKDFPSQFDNDTFIQIDGKQCPIKFARVFDLKEVWVPDIVKKDYPLFLPSEYYIYANGGINAFYVLVKRK